MTRLDRVMLPPLPAAELRIIILPRLMPAVGVRSRPELAMDGSE